MWAAEQLGPSLGPVGCSAPFQSPGPHCLWPLWVCMASSNLGPASWQECLMKVGGHHPFLSQPEAPSPPPKTPRRVPGLPSCWGGSHKA